MNTRRTFTADEIARILNVLAGDDPFDLGGGLFAVRMASKDKIVFKIERDGKEHPLKDADAAELAAISAVLWEKGKEFIPDDRGDDLTPEDLKDKPEDPNLEPDPTGLIPDWARQTVAEAARARRVKDGTATVDDLLRPEGLKDEPDAGPLSYPSDDK